MPSDDTAPRPPLTKERVLQAAVEVADREGLGALTMRRLGAELGVEAMSLYKHVADKEEILDGILDVVVGEIEIPDEGNDWKETMRRRAASARAVLSRHSWAIGLLEGRGSGRGALRYLDAILGSLRAAGFSVEDAARAFWLLDSYVYGHVVQETSVPSSVPETTNDPAGSGLDEFPHVVEVREHAQVHGYSLDDEFEFGLELILDGLERTAASAVEPYARRSR
jgi:AcrR family transcriptional regulator